MSREEELRVLSEVRDSQLEVERMVREFVAKATPAINSLAGNPVLKMLGLGK